MKVHVQMLGYGECRYQVRFSISLRMYQSSIVFFTAHIMYNKMLVSRSSCDRSLTNVEIGMTMHTSKHPKQVVGIEPMFS